MKTNNNLDSTLKYARDYVSKGFSVIPIRHRDKRPLISWTEYQKRKATDEELIDRLLRN